MWLYKSFWHNRWQCKSYQRRASGTAYGPRWPLSLSCPLWLLRRLEEARYLMLEQAMAALQVHHVARIGDDHVPLIRVRELLEEGEEPVKIGHIIILPVDEHCGHRHELGIEHGHEGHHV